MHLQQKSTACRLYWLYKDLHQTSELIVVVLYRNLDTFTVSYQILPAKAKRSSATCQISLSPPVVFSFHGPSTFAAQDPSLGQHQHLGNQRSCTSRAVVVFLLTSHPSCQAISGVQYKRHGVTIYFVRDAVS